MIVKSVRPPASPRGGHRKREVVLRKKKKRKVHVKNETPCGIGNDRSRLNIKLGNDGFSFNAIILHGDR